MVNEIFAFTVPLSRGMFRLQRCGDGTAGESMRIIKAVNALFPVWVIAGCTLAYYRPPPFYTQRHLPFVICKTF